MAAKNKNFSVQKRLKASKNIKKFVTGINL